MKITIDPVSEFPWHGGNHNNINKNRKKNRNDNNSNSDNHNDNIMKNVNGRDHNKLEFKKNNDKQ